MHSDTERDLEMCDLEMRDLEMCVLETCDLEMCDLESRGARDLAWHLAPR